MTDAESSTPFEEHDFSIDPDTDYDVYGLHEKDEATNIIRIDHDTHVFERVGMVECHSTGVVLKEHTKLTDEVSEDAIEVYQPIQFVSSRADNFETRLQDAIFDFIYDGKVSQETAEELSNKLTESMSNQYSDASHLY